MSRKAIRLEVLKVLLARSGNQCAFPNCNHPVFNDDNLLIAQLCHIEAVSPGGPRYNPNQNSNERNNYENLLFLCYRHHKETDNSNIYTTLKLKNIKELHERRFTNLPFNVNFDMMLQVNEEMKKYWEEIQVKNREDITELRMEIEINSSYAQLTDEVTQLIELISDALKKIAGDDELLHQEVTEFLISLGYDIEILERVSYNNNPLINRNWELHNIGWPNWINKLRLRLKQMEIKYYEEYLTIYPKDDKMTQRLEGIKGEFKYMSKNYNYFD